METFQPLARYYVVGREVGEQGTPHLQGYVELNKQMRFTTLKKKLPKCHIEFRNGSPSQAADYCKKEDKDPIEFGRISQPGKRNDLIDMYAAVKSGKSNLEVAEEHTASYIRYYKAIAHLRTELIKPAQFTAVKTHVLYGAAGTGKTRYVVEKYGDEVYFLDNYPWFDGYVGQSVLLLDDFYGDIPYRTLLRLLDGYRMQLAVKGGFTKKDWQVVYITSNDHPDYWYPQGLSGALRRRLTTVREFKKEPETGDDSEVGV